MTTTEGTKYSIDKMPENEGLDAVIQHDSKPQLLGHLWTGEACCMLQTWTMCIHGGLPPDHRMIWTIHRPKPVTTVIWTQAMTFRRPGEVTTALNTPLPATVERWWTYITRNDSLSSMECRSIQQIIWSMKNIMLAHRQTHLRWMLTDDDKTWALKHVKLIQTKQNSPKDTNSQPHTVTRKRWSSLFTKKANWGTKGSGLSQCNHDDIQDHACTHKGHAQGSTCKASWRDQGA